MAQSQNGFPASSNRAAIGVKTFAVPGYPQVKLAIRADVAPLLLTMARWFFDNIEKPVVPGNWGFADRNIRGSSTTLSNHASGTAIDLNAPKHPLGKVGTVPANKRKAIGDKARALGLRWGGDYTGRKDEMHFEVNVSLAKAKQLVAALQGKPQPPATGKPPAAAHPTIRQGSRGDAVRQLQLVLNRWYPSLTPLVTDGVFGTATAARVRYLQQRAGIAVDGIVGANTWRVLGFAA